MTQCFQPSARQMNWLIAIGFGSVFYAYYLRYRVIENTQVFMACQEGLDTWLCATLDLGILLFNQGAFGAVAVVAASLHLLWPSVLLFALALGAAGFGLVMQNGDMAGFAVGLLVLSLARPARSPG
jgi:hypothetical protein